MRELTENEMTLVAGGIGLQNEDSIAFTPPSIPGSGARALPAVGLGSGGNGSSNGSGSSEGSSSSGGDVKKIVQEACGGEKPKSVTVEKKGSSVGVKIGYTPPKKITVTPSYNSGSTTVTVECN